MFIAISRVLHINIFLFIISITFHTSIFSFLLANFGHTLCSGWLFFVYAKQYDSCASRSTITISYAFG